jgi:hypothetical protein
MAFGYTANRIAGSPPPEIGKAGHTTPSLKSVNQTLIESSIAFSESPQPSYSGSPTQPSEVPHTVQSDPNYSN